MRFPGRMRRVPAAAGTVGAVLGLILILMGVTGGIAASRLWHVQQVLDRAAHAAAVSEAQNGCWTNTTSQIVSQILQGGGLPITGAHAVQVTQYTSPQETAVPYGQLVTAGLQWSVPISVVRIQLPTTVPLSSTVDQPSQYVALGAQNNGVNTACTTPTLANAGSLSIPASPLAISSVQIVPNGQDSALITITGSGFGNSMPSLYTAPWGGQDTNHVELSYGQWNFGYWNRGNSPNAAGLQYLSWSPTTIVVEYPGDWSNIGPYPLNGGTLNVMVTVGGQTATFAQSVPSTGSSATGSSTTTILYNGAALPTPTQPFDFTPSQTGTYTLSLAIDNPPSWTTVTLTNMATGQQIPITPTMATNDSSCPNFCQGTAFGNTSMYTFTIPVSLLAGNQYQLSDTGSGGNISEVAFTS